MPISIPVEALPTGIGINDIKAIEPETIHAAQLEMMIAERTTALWYRNAGHRHSYQWQDSDHAPYANITAYDTWHNLLWTDPVGTTVTFNIPWLMHPGSSTIKIRGFWSYPFDIPMLVKWEYNGMFTADSEYSDDSEATEKSPVLQAPNCEWREYSNRILVTETSFTIASSPKDILATLIPYVKTYTSSGVDPYVSSFEPKIVLYGAEIIDVFDGPTS